MELCISITPFRFFYKQVSFSVSGSKGFAINTRRESRKEKSTRKMGGDGSPRLMCLGAEACKDLKLICKPHRTPVCFYDQKPPLQSGWWIFTSLGAGRTITNSRVLCTSAIQGVCNASTCSPTPQVRLSLGFTGREWFNLEILFIEELRGRKEYGEEHLASFSGTIYK